MSKVMKASDLLEPAVSAMMTAMEVAAKLEPGARIMGEFLNVNEALKGLSILMFELVAKEMLFDES